jgi:tyrosine-specific transport protein
MNLKAMGGTMIVIGTCLGAGVLGLPVATASHDLLSSSLLIIICWALMTAGALYILETTLKLHEGANFISMAKQTIGKPGAFVTWIVNLLLLYALLAAYITGGMQITQTTLHLSSPLAALLFTLIMGFIVLKGIYWVDHSNRALLTVKMLALFLLIAAIFPHTQTKFASFGSSHKIFDATTVIICSFGYATVIPSLRVYFKSDAPMLKRTIFIGSGVPLLIYIIWNIAVHSTLPSTGSQSLLAMQQSGNASSQLAGALTAITHSSAVKWFADVFTSICVLTSFLGVALSLSDFLEDGTGVSKKTPKGMTINAVMTFLPPLAIAIFYPKAFIIALSFGGMFSIILLIILPALMAICAHYKLRNTGATYQVFGGQTMRFLVLILALVALVLSVIYF